MSSYQVKEKTSYRNYNAYNDAMSPTIVAAGYCPKTLLASSVPLFVQEKASKQSDRN